MKTEELRPRFRGVLLGVAVGDALGARYEGRRVPRWETLLRLVDSPGALRYTDDTHMTIGLAESLLERDGFDGAHMAHLFARNYAAEPWRGYGRGPRLIFRLLQRGVPWDEAARSLFGGTGSLGNGAAMRVAPAALFAFPDLEAVEELARRTALVTHTHELGIEGAALQACAVALLLLRPPGEPLEAGEYLRALGERLRTEAFRERLERVRALLPEAPREEVVARVGNGVEAHEAVPAALYAFLRHPRSFAEAVLYAISLGGDTDTIACMTGALAGAHLGEEAIPPSWRQGVEGADRLRELADALLLRAAGRGS